VEVQEVQVVEAVVGFEVGRPDYWVFYSLLEALG